MTHETPNQTPLMQRLAAVLAKLPEARPAEKDMTAARDARRAELLSAARLPDRQWKHEIEAKAGWSKALADTRGMMLNPNGSIVALVGHRGTGKTQLAVEIARARINATRSVRYATERDMLAQIRATYVPRSDSSEIDAIRSFVNPSLLILDELQPRTAEDAWAAQMLAHIVDARYAAMKHTILVTNMDPDAFARHAGESITSRINETGGVITCQWDGFR